MDLPLEFATLAVPQSLLATETGQFLLDRIRASTHVRLDGVVTIHRLEGWTWVQLAIAALGQGQHPKCRRRRI
jgi:hypothetical protein